MFSKKATNIDEGEDFVNFCVLLRKHELLKHCVLFCFLTQKMWSVVPLGTYFQNLIPTVICYVKTVQPLNTFVFTFEQSIRNKWYLLRHSLRVGRSKLFSTQRGGGFLLAMSDFFILHFHHQLFPISFYKKHYLIFLGFSRKS